MRSTYAVGTQSTLPRKRALAFGRFRLGASKAQTLLALALYFGLGCFISWPIPIHPGSSVFGPIGADLTGAMAYYHGLAAVHTPPFLPGTVHVFNAPEGRSTQWALNFSTLPSSTLLWLGSMAIGSIATFGYWGVLSFTLTGLSMFLFVRWLTGNREAGLVSGLAFGFWPYVFTGMNQPLGHAWVVVVFAWRMLVAIDRPTVRNGLLAGGAAVLALMWVQYFLLIVGVTWAVLVVCALVLGWMRHELRLHIRTQIAGAVPVVVALVAIAAAGFATSFSGVPERPGSDLVQYSARPAMYLLPDPANPFTGSLTRPIIDRDYYSAHSTAQYDPIYLGISVLLLAAVGMWLLVRTIRRRGATRALMDRRILAAVVFSITAVVALAFSAPPQVTLLGIQVPMPMDVVGHLTTVFRTTSRFALIVMLGLCVLVGSGLSELLPRIRRNSTRLVVVATIAVIVTCDLWARPNWSVSHVVAPSIYHVLAGQPKGIYAEYPLQNGADFGGASTVGFYQAYAGAHDLFSGYFPNTDSESRKMELQFLLANNTVPDLAGLGVRYLIVDRVGPGGAPGLYPHPGARIPGTQLISTDSYGALYRITAAPPALSSFAVSGFSLPEGSGPGFWRWMTASTGHIEVLRNGSLPALFRVSFNTWSYLEERRLRITDGHGRLLYSGVIPATETRVSFDMTVGRRVVFNLSVWPQPRSPSSIYSGNPDTRTLGIQISEPLSILPQG